ncbi:glycoside hydrolase family 19 protein [Enterovirga sp. CN4-39]|uniref:glycoside hydrolase family 19 protein n=1 Tax=Enterovirga sp. CN4-39 TaxID=3400910 RepID=UPI003C2DA73D
MKQSQVDGMNAILAAAPADIDLEPLGYCLATTIHETARTMQPVKEYGGDAYDRRMYDIQGSRPAVAKALGNLQPEGGVRFCGRGYVQLTGRSNYLRAGRAVGVDLIAKPDLTMDPAVAARVMFEGMKAGWFTGKKLSDYFGPGRSDPVNARRIINGTERRRRSPAIIAHSRRL